MEGMKRKISFTTKGQELSNIIIYGWMNRKVVVSVVHVIIFIQISSEVARWWTQCLFVHVPILDSSMHFSKVTNVSILFFQKWPIYPFGSLCQNPTKSNYYTTALRDEFHGSSLTSHFAMSVGLKSHSIWTRSWAWFRSG